jgi:hypothetical protein
MLKIVLSMAGQGCPRHFFFEGGAGMLKRYTYHNIRIHLGNVLDEKGLTVYFPRNSRILTAEYNDEHLRIYYEYPVIEPVKPVPLTLRLVANQDVSADWDYVTTVTNRKYGPCYHLLKNTRVEPVSEDVKQSYFSTMPKSEIGT